MVVFIPQYLINFYLFFTPGKYLRQPHPDGSNHGHRNEAFLPGGSSPQTYADLRRHTPLPNLEENHVSQPLTVSSGNSLPF